MADTGIFATTAEVQYKAGSGASATANVETYINSYMTQAESYINAVCNYNYSDAYTGLNVDKKGLLKEAASDIAASYVVNFDMSGYTSLNEAIAMQNFLWARANACIELLKVQQTNVFVKAA
jgi:hypothetical protein